MDATYIKALEKRATWLKWLKYNKQYQTEQRSEDTLYRICLEEAETFVMNEKFCDLVNHARYTVPDDLKFELNWPPTKSGWMWLEKPFDAPQWLLDDKNLKQMRDSLGPLSKELVALKMNEISKIKISAIGWLAAEKTTDLADGRRYAELYSNRKLPTSAPTAYSFLCFFDLGDYFEKWAYFTFTESDTIADKVKKFEDLAEKQGGHYNPEQMQNHEIRWIYTAFHLMAQKLAMHVEHETDRATKRRAEREKKTVAPKFKVVTLRRMELDRQQEPNAEGRNVEWHWQWAVRGHWRNQWYASTKSYKQVFVEAYIKGPEGKPMKPLTQKIFVAKR